MNSLKKFIKSTAGMVFIVTVLVGIAVHIATGNFFTSYNISTLSRAASFAIIVGFGQTIVLLTGGIDLSVATIGQVCGMASAIFMVNSWNESISCYYHCQPDGYRSWCGKRFLYCLF